MTFMTANTIENFALQKILPDLTLIDSYIIIHKAFAFSTIVCSYHRFEKKVRYASRKVRADTRRRVKGRFVKAGEAYDYDPMSQTRSY